ncbi:MAG: hypothetical protein NC307_15350 [Roseburia sp.]|nr:hypothetical protein [Roseburia sp.]
MGSKVLGVSLAVVLFILEEYLTADKVKIQLVTKFWSKMLDYGYNFIFQDSGIWTLLALAFNSYFVMSHAEKLFGSLAGKYLSKGLSLTIFAVGMHRLSTHGFEISSFADMKRRFERVPFQKADYKNENLTKRMELLVEIEDKSYFYRENTYNWISREFIRYRFFRWKSLGPSGKKKNRWYFFLQKCVSYVKNYGMISLVKKGMEELHWSFEGIRPFYWLKMVFKRGYATLEMQLIRNIGIERGYEKDKHIIRRKIFEVIYSYIFFDGLKHHYGIIRKGDREHFKKMILYVYLYSVDTKVDGRRIDPLISMFSNEEGKIPDNGWEVIPMEVFFVLYLGLNHRYIYPARVALYENTILKYGMNMGMILALPQKIAGKEMIQLTVEEKKMREDYPMYVVNGCILPVIDNGIYYGPKDWLSYGRAGCRRFAGMVYYKIWGETFTSFADTEDNLIPMDTALSERSITPEHVQYYISRSYSGAAIRICDEIYGNDLQGEKKHSQILLEVLENGLILYESNDEHTEIAEYTWEEYADKYSEYRYFKYIKCPYFRM